ncbi:MAG: flagellar biosynthesis anti-sigma factor FlgM [Planctomycetaceae bacterium]|nr:flagellar biosynthesis anti-sigma factor FlgM [Planctomycetaceae bacterium]
MEVRGLSSSGTAAPVNRVAPAPAAGQAAATGPVAVRDEVEISAVGRILDDASRTTGVREQRLAEIKAAIDEGSYETPEKLEIALDRLLQHLGGEEMAGR